MYEPFEIKGTWWVAGSPKKKLTGILKCSNLGEIRLELIGSFVTNSENRYSPEIILGICDAKPITLYSCHQIELNTNIRNIKKGSISSSHSVITARVAFVGAHLKSKEDMFFTSIEANFDYLSDWTQMTGFQPEITEDIDSSVIKYKMPESIKCVIGNGISLSISLQRHNQFSQHQHTISEKTFVTLSFSDGHNFQNAKNLLIRFQDFLSFALRKYSSPTSIKCTISPKIKRLFGYRQVDVYFQVWEATKFNVELTPEHVFFYLPEIKDQLGHIMYHWYFRDFRLQPGYDLYFGILSSRELYDYNIFLNLSQAIESYHRLNYGGLSFNVRDYERLKDSILAVIVEPEQKEWMSQKLAYMNEISLRKRITGLADSHKQILRDYLGDRKKFIDNFVNTRNYLTHYDEALEDKKLEGIELFLMNRQLSLIVETLIMWEIGFTDEMILKAISRQRSYRQLKKLIGSPRP